MQRRFNVIGGGGGVFVSVFITILSLCFLGSSATDFCPKWPDRSLFDTSVKFGTVVVYNRTIDISFDAKLNRSKICYFGVKC